MNSLSGKFQLTIGKKKFECHLSMNAFRMLCEKEDLSLEQLQAALATRPVQYLPGVLYYGVINHHHFNNKPTDDLPAYEYFSAHILDDADKLPTYVGWVGKVFNGEEEQDEEGKK